MTLFDIFSQIFYGSTSNTTYAKLNYSYETVKGSTPGSLLTASIVPLKCGTGGVCAPLVEEEKSIQSEVSWGTLTLTTTGTSEETRQFDFLTSNFGGKLPLPDQPLTIRSADPIDGCEPILTLSEGKYATSGIAVMVHRGVCRFDIKALHSQEAGAQLMIVANTEDEALQRVVSDSVCMVGWPYILKFA
jgi:hypothetical protein